AADRIRRIIHAVDQPNFRTTLDVGNFVCVDEAPEVSVAQNLPYAMVVHFKDFYIRPAEASPGEGWFRSRGGKHLRGAVVGNGDIDLAAVARALQASDFSGYASIEFEGWEDCLLGCERGIANAKRLLDQACSALHPLHPLTTPDSKDWTLIMTKLRIGVIGAGSIAAAHLDAYAAHPDVELIAVADINLDRARAVADRYGAARAYDDAHDLLAADDIDCVSICTWNDTHAVC